MEIITKVKDFPEKIKYHHIPPDTYIRVIINKVAGKKGGQSIFLPIMTREKQIDILNLMPKAYEPGASRELIGIIESSHINTL